MREKTQKFIVYLFFILFLLLSANTQNYSKFQFPVVPISGDINTIELHIASFMDETVHSEIETRFKEKNPNISSIFWYNPLEWRTWDKKIALDIYWGGGLDYFSNLYKESKIRSIQNIKLNEYIKSNIQEPFKWNNIVRMDAKGEIIWAASSISAYGLLMNVKTLNESGMLIPASWEDLASSRFKSEENKYIAFHNNYNEEKLGLILDKYGWEYGWEVLTRIAANAKLYPYPYSSYDAMVQGNHSITITDAINGALAIEKNCSFSFRIPPNSSMLTMNGIAIAADSIHSEYAEAFIEYILSEEGQSLLLNPDINLLPVVSTAFNYSKIIFNYSRDEFERIYASILHQTSANFNYDSIGLGISSYFLSSMAQCKQKLDSIWNAMVNALNEGIISSTDFSSISYMMGNPRITLKEIEMINANLLDDPDSLDEFSEEQFEKAAETYNIILKSLSLPVFTIKKPFFNETVSEEVTISARAGNNESLKVTRVKIEILNSTSELKEINITTNFSDINFTIDIGNFSTGKYLLLFTVYYNLVGLNQTRPVIFQILNNSNHTISTTTHPTMYTTKGIPSNSAFTFLIYLLIYIGLKRKKKFN